MISFDRSEDIAIVDPERGTRLSYTQMKRRVSELIPLVSSPKRGVTFVLCDNSVDSILLYLAGIESENTVALLDGQLAQDRIAGFVAAYRPELVIDFSKNFKHSSYVPEEHEEFVVSRKKEAGEPFSLDGETKLLLPTSGSTGSGKMVRLSMANLKANAASIAAALDINSDERAVLSLPIQYSYGLSILNSHLLSGASVVVTRHMLTSKEFWNHMRDTDTTSFAGVPYSYEILKRLDLNALNVPKLMTMTQAGGKLANNLIEHFHSKIASRGGRFFTMYGQTEATARIAILPSALLPEKLGSVGKAIPGGSIGIAKQESDDGQAIAQTIEGYVVGEVVYKGPNVMLGYASNREDLNQKDVNQGVLRTGDIGYLDGDGLLYITGRTQRIGKIFGLRLNLDEVEALLQREGPLAVVSDDRRLLIYCEGEAYARVESKKQELAQSLGIHHSAICPRSLEFLPRKSNGKIDYMKLMTGD